MISYLSHPHDAPYPIVADSRRPPGSWLGNPQAQWLVSKGKSSNSMVGFPAMLAMLDDQRVTMLDIEP